MNAAVLAAVLEEPCHAYEVWVRINRRLGANWERRRVYEALERFEREGLVVSGLEWTAKGSSPEKRVYQATELGGQIRAASVEKRLPVGRATLEAWLVFSSPEESEQILAALDEYEKDCMEMAEGRPEVPVRTKSWRSRMLIVSRESLCEQIELEVASEIAWIKRARREIEEYLAESR